MSTPSLYIGEHHINQHVNAIATALNLGIVSCGPPCRHQLFVNAHHQLAIRCHANPVLYYVVDFTDRTHQQLKKTSGKKTALARAIGAHKVANLHILDACAGFGREAFLMAHWGHTVQMIEASPLVQALVHDGLARWRASPDHLIASRLTLTPGDACQALATRYHAADFDVIYLDPMFPSAHLGKAKVKKPMQILRHIGLALSCPQQLLARARDAAKGRVVVKRPLGATPWQQPSFTVSTASMRFDVYLCS